MSPLSDAHRRTLKETSGLTDAVIDARGYKTLSEQEFAIAVAQGFYRPELLEAKGWMAIPVIRPDGVHHCDIVRLDSVVKKFENQKYIWPKGFRNAIDISPFTAQYVKDNTVPLIITEGIKKGDALASSISNNSSQFNSFCVASINGCWGWRAKLDGVSVANPDLYDVGLNERQIILIVDSDYYINDDVKAGWDGFAGYLASKAGAHKIFLCVVPMVGLKKQGADDYLLEHSLDDLLSYCRTPKQAEISYAVPSLDIVTGKDILDSSKESISWMVNRVMPEASVTVMAGHTTTFKTWHALRLCFDVMLGRAFLDNENFEISTPCSVLYINREMGRQLLGSRMHNYMQYETINNYKDELDSLMNTAFHGLDNPLFNIGDTQTQDQLIAYANQNNIRLTVLDTFSMVWNGDENSSQEVAAFYNILRRISSETGMAWLLIHHLTKPTRDRAGFDQLFAVRGSGQIIQQADSALTLNIYDTSEFDTRIKLIHAKSRAALSHPAFLTRFMTDPDSYARGLIFDSLLSEDRAHAAITGGDDGIRTWMLTVMGDQETLDKGPGLSWQSLFTILQTSWPKGDKQPTERKMKTVLDQLVKEDILVITDRNVSTGAVYMFHPDALKNVMENDKKEETNE